MVKQTSFRGSLAKVRAIPAGDSALQRSWLASNQKKKLEEWQRVGKLFRQAQAKDEHANCGLGPFSYFFLKKKEKKDSGNGVFLLAP